MSDVNQPVPEATQPIEQATPAAPPDQTASRPPLPWETPAPESQDAQPVEVQAEPEPVQEETAPSEPTTPPPFDPAEVERLRAQAEQFEELQRRVREEQERLSREQEQQRLDQEFQRRADEIWDIAQRFDTDEERRGYYQQQMTALRAETASFYRQQAEAERAKLEQERMAQAIAGYPDWLGKEFGLDEAEVEELRTLNDFNQMTAVAKGYKRMRDKYGQLEQIAQQARADIHAQKQSQAIAPGGGGGAPVSQEEIKPFRSGTRESRAMLADIFGIGN